MLLKFIELLDSLHPYKTIPILSLSLLMILVFIKLRQAFRIYCTL